MLAQPSKPAQTSKEVPLRLLLLREKCGELPWVVKTIVQVMAPVDVVQVSGLASAVWRLGHERFDSVLLDLDPRHRQAVDIVRRHIGDVAAVPVLDLNEDEIVPTPRGATPAAAPRAGSRPPRPPREADGGELRWPPRVNHGQGGPGESPGGPKRRSAKPRVRAPFLAAVE